MAFEDRETYSPLFIFEHENKLGNYSLLLTDQHMVGAIGELFETAGRQSSGYTWADVALQAMRSSSPELEERLSMDPEAGMFCAYGEDLEAIKALGALLHTAYHDRSALAELVRNAPYEYD